MVWPPLTQVFFVVALLHFWRMSQYQALDHGPGPSLKISFKTCAQVTVFLPFIAFVSCIVVSLSLHYEESTATHCQVRNCLPSISAAIGGFAPQRYIWRICIALHSAPRLLVGTMYFSYYRHYLGHSAAFRVVIWITCIAYMTENMSLIGMSYISSLDNKGMHEVLFIFFTVFSVLHMLLSYGMFRYLGELNKNWGQFSRKLKLTFIITNVLSLTAALYCYFRHNTYCEPLVYTFFAFFEYLFVVSNMGFHMTAYFDFHDYEFEVKQTLVHKIRWDKCQVWFFF